MATHFKGPLLTSRDQFGGLAGGANLYATDGMSDAITTFDDFNDVIQLDSFSATTLLEQMGWVLADVNGPANDSILMNDVDVPAEYYTSCLLVSPGTVVDSGGNMQLDLLNSAYGAGTATGPVRSFPHIWIPETAAGVTILDNTDFGFACRVGLMPSAATWDSKLFIGWAQAADAHVMVSATGAIIIPSTGPLVGFHINEAGDVDGISHRTAATVMAEGTNFTNLVPGTSWNSGLTAGVPVWFDLALRMHITDMSDNAANGWTSFAWRRVNSTTRSGGPWTRHATVLQNQTPNHTIALVPTIEIQNGPVNVTSVLYLDWWTFGQTRFSHT